jgi:hypothetical protein
VDWAGAELSAGRRDSSPVPRPPTPTKAVLGPERANGPQTVVLGVLPVETMFRCVGRLLEAPADYCEYYESAGC